VGQSSLESTSSSHLLLSFPRDIIAYLSWVERWLDRTQLLIGEITSLDSPFIHFLQPRAAIFIQLFQWLVDYPPAIQRITNHMNGISLWHGRTTVNNVFGLPLSSFNFRIPSLLGFLGHYLNRTETLFHWEVTSKAPSGFLCPYPFEVTFHGFNRCTAFSWSPKSKWQDTFLGFATLWTTRRIITVNLWAFHFIWVWLVRHGHLHPSLPRSRSYIYQQETRSYSLSNIFITSIIWDYLVSHKLSNAYIFTIFYTIFYIFIIIWFDNDLLFDITIISQVWSNI